MLVLKGLPEGDHFEEEMLQHNEIPGVLRMETVRVAGEKQRRYRTDGCCSLAESLRGQKLSGEEFRMLMSSLFSGIAQGRKYLLREESFVLTPECVFVRNDTGDTELVYCPEYECPLAEQLRRLSDWLLEYLDAQDAEAVYNGYAFHVMSHETGNPMQRMVSVFCGVAVPGLPSPEGMQREVSADVQAICTAVEENSSGNYPNGDVIARGSGRITWGSFLAGLSVVTCLIAAVLWAMR
ncbi:MAG: hypothetical protein IKX54_00350 [Lachnospiraceae bacterium]|nr:hypothetical protein [Lachnospiraceae bacterium]